MFFFLGNKCDLESLREVEFAEAEAMCEYIPEILFVLEASAKENTNIDDAFICLATELKVRNYW
jgi:Ras-related protein Rab-43